MMTRQLRKRLYHAVDTLSPGVLAGLGSVYLSVRSRSRCAVRFEDGRWIHRYPTGTIVNTRMGGLSPVWQDRDAEDTFLFGYRPREGDTVVDVGAGVGGEARLFSRLVGDRGRVVSIEAHPGVFQCLRRTVELNGLTNVTPLSCAVVGRPGRVFIEDERIGHIGNGLTSAAAGGIEVTGRTLRDVIGELGIERISFLKINIEGAELPVLQGAGDVLGIVDNIAVSCHDFLADRDPSRHWQRTFAPVRAVLSAAGFSIRQRPDDERPWIRYYLYGSRAVTAERR